MRYVLLTVVLLSAAVGIVWFQDGLTHIGTPADPNNPVQAGLLKPEVLRADLQGASESLMNRVNNNEISDAQFKDYMAKAANSLLSHIDIERIPPKKAWEYGDIYITARRWDDAVHALTIAVKAAKDDDRRVNDSLHLARALAETGKVPEAVQTARSVFKAPNGACAPILPATLLEIVPAGAGKGHDADLAGLLEEAIKCEERTVVDPKTIPGRSFLAARPYHVEHAWRKVIELYMGAKQVDEAKAAEKRAEQDLKQQAGA